MGQTKKPDYVCIRCGYQTRFKNDMRRHFANKKPCPTVINDIELTDEIKNHIINFRIYHIKKPREAQKIINQTINNYNTMNNFISSMDTIEKIQKLLKHQQSYLLDFDTHVERTFQPRIEELQNGGDDIELQHDDIIDLVDLVTKISKKRFEDTKNLDAFNVVYDKDIKRLKIYSGGEWSDFITTRGIKRIVETIKDNYLDRYECYLIRKINNTNETHWCRQRARELLDEYYKFLNVFDVMPHVHDNIDRNVMYDKSDDRFYRASDRTEYCEKYMDRFRKVGEDITKHEINKIQKTLFDIVKHNTKKNIDELNKQVLTLLNADDQFKASVIPLHVLNG